MNRLIASIAALALFACASAAHATAVLRIDWIKVQAVGQAQPAVVFGGQDLSVTTAQQSNGSPADGMARITVSSGASVCVAGNNPTATETTGVWVAAGYGAVLLPVNAGDKVSCLEATNAPVAAAAGAALDATASGTISAADVATTTVSGQNAVALVSGTPTANSYIVVGPVSATSATSITVSGTFVGTIVVETSADGVTYVVRNPTQDGYGGAPTAITSVGIFHSDIASLGYIRVRASAWTSGSASIGIRLSGAPGLTKVMNGLRLLDSSGSDTSDTVNHAVKVNIVAGATTNASVGSNTATAPTSSTLIGSKDASGNLQAASAANPLPVFSQDCVEGTYSATGINAGGVVTLTTPSGGTTASINTAGCGYVIFATPTPGSGNTVAPQWASDGATFASAEGIIATVTTPGLSSSFSASSTTFFIEPVVGTSLRANVTAFTSGPMSIYVTVKRASMPPGYFINASASITGTATVGPATNSGANPATMTRVKSAATTNAQNLRASSGRMYGYHLCNQATYAVYPKWYNKASSPTVGTDTPLWTDAIPAAVDAAHPVCLDGPRPVDFGVGFGTGISFAITKNYADSDTTAVAADDVFGYIATQ